MHFTKLHRNCSLIKRHKTELSISCENNAYHYTGIQQKIVKLPETLRNKLFVNFSWYP